MKCSYCNGAPSKITIFLKFTHTRDRPTDLLVFCQKHGTDLIEFSKKEPPYDGTKIIQMTEEEFMVEQIMRA